MNEGLKKNFFENIAYKTPEISSTKSTNAQGKLKLRSVITREEGGLGFLIIPRAQPKGWLKTLIHPTPEVLQISVLTLMERGFWMLLESRGGAESARTF